MHISHLLLLLGAQTADETPVLSVGTPVSEVIRNTTAEVHTETLDVQYVNGATRGVTYRVSVDATGPHHFELRSDDFDAYLVVRTADGSLLAEDDDGWLATQSRLAIELRSGEEYLVTACALHGAIGRYELILRVGIPIPLEGRERQAAEIGDLTRRIARYAEIGKKEDVELLVHLINLGNAERDLGGFEAEAEAHLLRAVALVESFLGPDNPQTMDVVAHLGVLYFGQGRYSEAEQQFRRMLSVMQSHYGDEHTALTTSMFYLAAALYQQGNLNEAVVYMERTLRMKEQVHGVDHVETVFEINNLAEIYRVLGRYREARAFHERALAIWRETAEEDPGAVARSLNNLALVLVATGRYAEAETMYLESLALESRATGERSEDYAMTSNNYAELLREVGRLSESRTWYELALEIQREVLKPGHTDIGQTLNNIALLNMEEGRDEEARVLMEQGLEIQLRELGPTHYKTLTDLQNLAFFYAREGRFAEARRLYEQVIKETESQLGPSHIDLARVTKNLGDLFIGAGMAEQALPLFDRAIGIYEAARQTDHQDLAKTYSNLAQALIEVGRHEEAMKHLVRAHEIVDGMAGLDRIYAATILHNIADLECVLGQTEAALRDNRAAFAVFEDTFGMADPRSSQSLRNLAICLAAEERWSEAVLGLQRALAGHLDYLTRELPTMGETGRFHLLAENQQPTGLLQAHASAPELAVGESFDLYLRWKGMATRLQAAGLSLKRRSGDEEVERSRDDVRALSRELAALIRTPLNDQVADHEEAIVRLRAARLKKEAELNRLLDLESALEVPGWREIQAALPADAVLVDFHTGTVVFAWVLLPTGEPKLLELGGQESLKLAVETLLEGVAQRHRSEEMTKQFEQAGVFLTEQLWSPVRDVIGSASTVLVSPDGFLCALPLGVLRDEDGDWLLKHHQFVYLSDASRVAQPHAATEDRSGSMLAIGNVDYDLRANEAALDEAFVGTRSGIARHWNPLQGTSRELSNLRKLHIDTLAWSDEFTSLSGSEATEERICREVAGRRYLHFGTHGFFEPDDLPSLTAGMPGFEAAILFGEQIQVARVLPGLLSGLVLAGANDPQPDRDDGYLTAEEIQHLDLSACHLAVLSACETALGSSRSGEGMMSLRRSVEVAGARTVVSTLWKVDDAVTAALINRFYENYWLRGMAKAEALHEAQRWMLDGGGAPGADDPFAWGAVVLSGDWR